MSANFLHPQDQVRNTYFNAVYNWAINVIVETPTCAFFIAKKRTLAKYPINKGEPLYPIK